MLKCLARILTLLVLAAGPAVAGNIQHVFVIAMENTDARSIYGNTKQAPYINNQLLPAGARATRFLDLLPLAVHSEPHYVLMEAGRRNFPDHNFSSDDDPSATNSTASHQHLVRQFPQSSWPVAPTWMSYQQSMNAKTGTCPTVSKYPYAAKHNPFVFFQDVAGNPPAKSNAFCAQHHKPFGALAGDLAGNTVANYVFIAPDLCHDMHDRCGASSRIKAGDSWLAGELPAILTWANAHQGVVFIVWDEGEVTAKLPFIALGTGVVPGATSNVEFNHKSFVKSLELIFGLPILPTVSSANTFDSLFAVGAFP